MPDDEVAIEAKRVVLPLELRYFNNIPEDHQGWFLRGTFRHTSEPANIPALRGRQSALERTALIHAQAAGEIHLAYRHAALAFNPSAWVNPVMLEL